MFDKLKSINTQIDINPTTEEQLIIDEENSINDEKLILQYYLNAIKSQHKSISFFITLPIVAFLCYMTGSLGYDIGSASDNGNMKYILSAFYGFVSFLIVFAGFFMAYDNPLKTSKFDLSVMKYNIAGLILFISIVVFNFVSLQHEVGNLYQNISNKDTNTATQKELNLTSIKAQKATFKKLSQLNLSSVGEYEIALNKIALPARNAKILRRTKFCKSINSRLKRSTKRRYVKLCNKYNGIKNKIIQAELLAKVTTKLEASGLRNDALANVKTNDGGNTDKVLMHLVNYISPFKLVESDITENKPLAISALLEFIAEFLILVLTSVGARSAMSDTKLYARKLVNERSRAALDRSNRAAQETIDNEISKVKAENELVKSNIELTATSKVSSLSAMANSARNIDFSTLPKEMILSMFIVDNCVLDGTMVNSDFNTAINKYVHLNGGSDSQMFKFAEFQSLLLNHDIIMSDQGLISGLSLK